MQIESAELELRKGNISKWMTRLMTGVSILIVIAGGIFVFEEHVNASKSIHDEVIQQSPLNTDKLQAQTADVQQIVNQMTPTQQAGLHQLLSRDAAITDYLINDGKLSEDGSLVGQLENDFQTFKNLFPNQMAVIGNQPITFFKGIDFQGTGFSKTKGDSLTFNLSIIYLAYDGVIGRLDGHAGYAKKLANILDREEVSDVFAHYNRIWFGGRLNPKSLVQ